MPSGIPLSEEDRGEPQLDSSIRERLHDIIEKGATEDDMDPQPVQVPNPARRNFFFPDDDEESGEESGMLSGEEDTDNSFQFEGNASESFDDEEYEKFLGVPREELKHI
jgi:hypothetical protein